jgi:hypothetical protein
VLLELPEITNEREGARGGEKQTQRPGLTSEGIIWVLRRRAQITSKFETYHPPVLSSAPRSNTCFVSIK